MKTFDLTVSRTIRGSADEVFDVWLDPKSPGGLWFGVERAIINPVVDGLFYHVVKHEGRSWPHYGRFIRLDRGRTIEHTWVSEATRGLETIVTITLAPSEDGTEVTLHHANVPDDDMGRGHQDGWTWYLNVLAGAVRKGRGQIGTEQNGMPAEADIPLGTRATTSRLSTDDHDHPHSLKPHTWHFMHPSANSSCEPQSGQAPDRVSCMPPSTICSPSSPATPAYRATTSAIYG